MNELTPSAPEHFVLTCDQAGQPHFPVLVADDDETDHRSTIWHLGEARPFEGDIMVKGAGDGTEALE